MLVKFTCFAVVATILVAADSDTCALNSDSCGMAPLKLLIIAGSTRDGRMGDRVTKFIVEKLKDAHYDVEVLDPLELNLPMLKQPLHFYPDQNQAPEILRKLNEKIKSVDAYVIITPEYNRQMPPALTNLIDYFPPRSYAYKSSAIITYSLGHGGANAAGQARTLMVEVGAPPIPYVLHITEVMKKLTEKGDPIDESVHKQVEKMLIQLNFYAAALKNHRQAVGEPQWGFAMSL